MQALYRKWRSQTFDEVIGQPHVTQTLRNALLDGRVAHAYLFSGPRGTGKTSTARILAKALNCSADEERRPCGECSVCVAITEGRMIDLIEIDAASNNSVDDIRELRDKVGFQPSEGRYKVYIIDEVHMLSTAAFNALLKTLEEPPPHTRFILATTEPHKIPATVISRCQRFDFRRIPVQEIAAHLQNIVTAEGFSAEYDALTAIGRSAQGCMRDAISLLDQMFSYGTDTISLPQVQQVLGTVNSEAVSSMVSAISQKDVTVGLSLVQQLLTEGASLVEYCHQVVEHLRGVLLLEMTQDKGLLSDLPKDVVERMAEQSSQISRSATLFAIKRFSEAASELKGGYQPQLPLELALIESIQGPATTVAQQPDSGNTAAAQVPISTPVSADISSSVAVQSPIAAQRSPSQSAPIPNGQAIQPGKPAPTSKSREVASSKEVQSDIEAVEQFRTNLRAFKAKVREECGHQVQAALNNVRDIAIADGEVVFAFGNNSFACDMIQNPEVHNAVTRILVSFLGQSVVLACQVGEKAKLSGLRMQNSGNNATDGADPLVQFAVNELGAEVAE